MKQTPCTVRSFVNTNFYKLKLLHTPQFRFGEFIIFNKIVHPSNQIHKKVNTRPLCITTYTIQSIEQSLSIITRIITLNTFIIIQHT